MREGVGRRELIERSTEGEQAKHARHRRVFERALRETGVAVPVV